MIRRGDVYLVNWGQGRGSEPSGIRPSLVIQNDAGNRSSETTIVAAMTTHQFSRDYPFHVEVSPDESGLRERSTVLLEQIQTVSIERIRNQIGQLSIDSMQQVDRAIHRSLGLVE